MVGSCRLWPLRGVFSPCLYEVRRTFALAVMEGLSFGVCVVVFCSFCVLSVRAVGVRGDGWLRGIIIFDLLLHSPCASYSGLYLLRVGVVLEC